MEPIGMEITNDIIQQSIDEICCIYEKEDVREIDFVPSFEPPWIMFQEHCLGISMKLLKPLYKYSYQELLRICSDIKLARNNKFVHQELLTSLLSQGLRISQVVLSVKGDMPMAYNVKKQAILQDLSRLNREIKFLSSIFSKHPKSPSGWNHRRWCLTHHMLIHNRSALLASEVETEKELCRIMTEKFPRNYYAWMHRFWLLQFMNDHQIGDELSFTHDWLISHVSDHSAVNHRMKVLEVIILHRNLVIDSVLEHTKVQEEKIFKFLIYIFNESTDLVLKRPGRESLWCYRRNLLTLLQRNLASHHKQLLILSETELNSCKLGDRLRNIDQCSHGTDQTLSVNTKYSTITDLENAFLKELNFAVEIISNPSLWDHEKQEIMAARYCLFVIDQLSNKENSKLSIVPSLISFLKSRGQDAPPIFN